MEYIRNATIKGYPEIVAKIKSLFGEVRFGGKEEKIELEITQILPNFYRFPNPEKVGAVLYVLIPNEYHIENIWPEENCNEVRFGTAHVRTGNWIYNVPALAIHKKLTTLYFCLTSEGRHINDIGALGI